MKKEAQVAVAMTQKKTQLQSKARTGDIFALNMASQSAPQDLDAQTDELKQRMDQEVMVNTELEAYLKETHKKLSARVCIATIDAPSSQY